MPDNRQVGWIVWGLASAQHWSTFVRWTRWIRAM